MDDSVEIKNISVTTFTKFATNTLYHLLDDYYNPKPPSDLMITGNIIHHLLLREEKYDMPHEKIKILEYDNYKTKETREIRDQHKENGDYPILQKDYKEILNKIPQELQDYFNQNNPVYEKSFSSIFEDFGRIKGRVDCLQDNMVVDLKVTTQNVNLDKLIFDSGYQLQIFLYMLLTGREKAEIIFYNYNNGLFRIKSFNLESLRDECYTLMNIAKKNMELLEEYTKKGLKYFHEGEYITPQWAYSNLINGGFK